MTTRTVDRIERALKWCGLLLSLAALGIIGGYLLASFSRDVGFPQYIPTPVQERPARNPSTP